MEPLSWPTVRFTFKSVGQRKGGKLWVSASITLANVTFWQELILMKKGLIIKVYWIDYIIRQKTNTYLLEELGTKLCYCHPFGEDLWCLLGAFGEQCTQMTGEQLVSRQSAQVPCQTKSQAAEQITFSNRQLRHASISFEKPIHFHNARVKMTSGHWPPYSCV